MAAAFMLPQATVHAAERFVDPGDPGVVVHDCRTGIDLVVSGQVNRAFLYADNGLTDDTFLVDNDNSSTRVRWVAEGQVNCTNKVGAQIEVQMESNSSADISFGQDSSTGGDSFTERKLEVWWENTHLGKVWLGQGDAAGNGSAEVDLSGTAVILYSGIADLAGGLEFENGIQINRVFSNFDGLSRRDRIRYDTPSFLGFSLSTSFTDEDFWDVALWFSRSFGGTKVAAAVAYSEFENKVAVRGPGGVISPTVLLNPDYRIDGSFSVLFANGFNITAGAGMDKDNPATRDGTITDPFFWYAKVGYQAAIFNFGKTNFAIDYTRTEDLNATGDEFQSVGIAIVQNIDHVGTELYAAARWHDLETAPGKGLGSAGDFIPVATSRPDAVFAVVGGARVRF